VTTRPGTTAGSTLSAGTPGGRDLRSERIRVVMGAAPPVAPRGTGIGACIAALQEARSDCVLITDAGLLAGILTERDILMKVLGRDADMEASVDGFMTLRPETLTPDDAVGDALALMDRGHFRHLPLTDAAGRPAGVLRQQDVIEYLAESFPQEILNLPPRPHQVMEGADGG
jgi:CBS domain-containing protein